MNLLSILIVVPFSIYIDGDFKITALQTCCLAKILVCSQVPHPNSISGSVSMSAL